MDDFHLRPADDLGLRIWERLSSVKRESGPFLTAVHTGWAVLARQFKVWMFAGLSCLLFAAYSVSGVIGFSAGERIGKSQHDEALAMAAQQKADEANKLAVEMRREDLES